MAAVQYARTHKSQLCVCVCVLHANGLKIFTSRCSFFFSYRSLFDFFFSLLLVFLFTSTHTHTRIVYQSRAVPFFVSQMAEPHSGGASGGIYRSFDNDEIRRKSSSSELIDVQRLRELHNAVVVIGTYS